jgi:glutathione S-transferase
MKLFYLPGTCSLAPHIVAREAGLPFDLVKVDRVTKRTELGTDYLALNPKGYVPALELDAGGVLTEGQVISQYLADRVPEAGLVPAAGTPERYRTQEWLAYIGTEIHKGYSPLFKQPALEGAAREAVLANLGHRYALIEAQLAKTPFLTGPRFGIADAYLFTVTRWAAAVKLDLTPFPHLVAFQRTVSERPAVQAALAAEGLLPKRQAA